jgi:hypothetical protein
MSIGLEYPFVDLGGEDRSITFFGDVSPEIRIRARHHPSEAECEVLTSGLDGEKAQARPHRRPLRGSFYSPSKKGRISKEVRPFHS